MKKFNVTFIDGKLVLAVEGEEQREYADLLGLLTFLVEMIKEKTTTAKTVWDELYPHLINPLVPDVATSTDGHLIEDLFNTVQNKQLFESIVDILKWTAMADGMTLPAAVLCNNCHNHGAIVFGENVGVAEGFVAKDGAVEIADVLLERGHIDEAGHAKLLTDIAALDIPTTTAELEATMFSGDSNEEDLDKHGGHK